MESISTIGLNRRLFVRRLGHVLDIRPLTGAMATISRLGLSRFRLGVLWAGQQTILKVTTLDPGVMPSHEEHLRRFVKHLPVSALLWINVGPSLLTFKTICKE